MLIHTDPQLGIKKGSIYMFLYYGYYINWQCHAWMCVWYHETVFFAKKEKYPGVKYLWHQNPTWSLVALLNFSVLHCPSSTYLVQVLDIFVGQEYEKYVACCLTSIDLSQSWMDWCSFLASANASTAISYNIPSSTEINRSKSNTGN